MADLMTKLFGQKKKTPQLGGSNTGNIEAMVAAGMMTAEEGRKMKDKMKEKMKGKNDNK